MPSAGNNLNNNPFLEVPGFPRPVNKQEQQMRTYMAGTAFSDRKITDLPTDSLQVVNRRYVNLNGTVANRPTSSVAVVGQFYFASNTNIPMWYNGVNWVNGVGSVVALG